MPEYVALVGIDWSDAKHDVCLLDSASGRREAAVIKHTPEELDRWADSLRRRYPGQRVAVCLEQARGPLVYALLKYDFFTLYPINPKTLAKFREAFTTSRAKDDPGDAAYLADLLVLHRDKLKAWLPDTALLWDQARGCHDALGAELDQPVMHPVAEAAGLVDDFEGVSVIPLQRVAELLPVAGDAGTRQFHLTGPDGDAPLPLVHVDADENSLAVRQVDVVRSHELSLLH